MSHSFQENFSQFLREFHSTLKRILLNFYKLLFHSLFKVEFDIDQFVLGEHRER